MNLPAWHEGVDPIEVDVDLRPEVGERHRISWRDGDLHLDDHPDVEADRALGALGGGRCRCVDVWEMWQLQLDAPQVLTIGRRSREAVSAEAATIVRLERQAKQIRAQWQGLMEVWRSAGDHEAVARWQPVVEAADRRLAQRVALMWLLGRDTRLHDRLQLSVLASAEEHWDDHDFRTANTAIFTAALAGRAAPALQEAGFDVPLEQIGLLPPGVPAIVRRDHVALPLPWLTNVWARGVAVHAGRFVTEVTAVHREPDGKVLAVRDVDGHDWRVRRP